MIIKENLLQKEGIQSIRLDVFSLNLGAINFS